jgi:hypothetical protein
MYLSAAISLVDTAWRWREIVAHVTARSPLPEARLAPQSYLLFAHGFDFGFTALFIWLIARRRKNWARWLWLTLFAVVGLPTSFKGLGQANPATGVLILVHLLIAGIAFFFIFTGDARAWFPVNSVRYLEAIRGKYLNNQHQ